MIRKKGKEINRVRKNKFPSWLVLVILVFILLFVKLAIVFSSTAKFFDPETLYRGTIANELMSGLHFNLFDYQLSGWEGGMLVSGILVSPFFFFFGRTILSLQMAAVLFLLLSLFILFFLLKRNTGIIAAAAGCLLFIFPPLEFLRRSLAYFGNHCESVFFSLIISLLLLELIYRPGNESRKRLLYLLLGLLSGFGIYFDYLVGIAVFACLIFLIAFDKGFFLKKTFILFFFGFVFGFSPWIYYNSTHHFQGLFIYSRSLGNYLFSNKLSGIVHNFRDFLWPHLSEAFTFLGNSSLSDSIFSAAYFSIFLFCLLFQLWSQRRSLFRLFSALIPLKRFSASTQGIAPKVFLIFYLIVFCSIFGIFIPVEKVSRPSAIWPFAVSIIAFSFTELWRYKKLRFIIAVFYLLILAIGLSTSLNFVTLNNPYQDYKTQGFSYFAFGDLIGNYEDCSMKRLTFADRFAQPYRDDYINGAASSIVRYCHLSKDTLKEVFSFKDRVKDKNLFFEWFGEGIGEGFSEDYHTFNKSLFDNYRNLIEDISRLDREAIRHFFHGLGNGTGKDYTRGDVFLNFLLEQAKEEGRDYFFFGYVEQMAKESMFESDYISRVICRFEQLEGKYKPYAFERLGWEVGLRFKGNLNDLSGYLPAVFIVSAITDGNTWVNSLQPKDKEKLLNLINRAADTDYWGNFGEPLSWSARGRFPIDTVLKRMPKDNEQFFCKGMGKALALRECIPRNKTRNSYINYQQEIMTIDIPLEDFYKKN